MAVFDLIFNEWNPALTGDEAFGVAVQATMGANLLRGDWIRRSDKLYEATLLNFAALLLCLVISGLPPFIAALACLIVAAGRLTVS